MAFEVPIEADRVDGSNLFGSLLRAPVLGLLHMLGAGRDDEESEAPSTVVSMPRKSSLKRCPSSLRGVDSHNSDIECSEALEGMHLVLEARSQSGLGSKKQLSWSDESGRELARVMTDEVSSLMCSNDCERRRPGRPKPAFACPQWTNARRADQISRQPRHDTLSIGMRRKCLFASRIQSSVQSTLHISPCIRRHGQ